MNLQDQLGALEMGLDDLLQGVVNPQRETGADTAEADRKGEEAVEAAQAVEAVETRGDAADERPTLNVSRPDRDAIELTIGGKSVLLNPAGVARLVEELSNARASMTEEQPQQIPAGWRYVSTKNPMLATQKYANGDRLLVLRHTGHGWVPFTFTPDMVIEMYAMLTKR